jgi:predicted phage terminase large subunit-like protein
MAASNVRRFVFNDKYQPLFSHDCPCRYYIITGGRGSGKSYAISSAVSVDHCKADYNTLYLRQTLVSAHVSIIPEYYEKLELMGMSDRVARSNTTMRNLDTGWSIYFRGIQTARGSNVAQLKSIKRVGLALVDEAQELVDEEAFDRIDLSLRDKGVRNRVWVSMNPPGKNHWIYRRFFKARGIADNYNGIAGDTCYIHTTYLDNLANLDDDFIRLATECKANNPSKYRNVFLGYFAGDKEGALWNAAMIDPYRVADAGQLDRIVVAVDPAVTNTKKSDETGIVVVGCTRLHGERPFYVLADRSMQASPATWAAAVANAYNEFKADRVVAEVNNGGDMVEQILRTAGQRMPYKAVHATRGKITRAEPVAALYEKGLVHHVGTFGGLEDQMRNYCGYDAEDSPDRMDALVWGITELSTKGGSGPVE